MSDKNSYKNHRENCVCAACAVVGIATEVAEIIDRLESEKEQLLQQMAELRAERDEARRSLCECRASGGFDSHDGDWFADDGRHTLARLDAAERGWDCFEEKS